MIAQYAALAFLLFSTALAVTAAWKSLATGRAQPASFVLERQGKLPIVRAERPFAYWNHTLPWLLMAPLITAFTAWMLVATFTWPKCSDTVREQCWYASN